MNRKALLIGVQDRLLRKISTIFGRYVQINTCICEIESY